MSDNKPLLTAAFVGGVAVLTALLHGRRGGPRRRLPSTPPARPRVGADQPRLAIVSCKELLEAEAGAHTESYGSTGGDEDHLYRALRARGLPFDVVAWDDPRVDWGSYPVIIVRTTWDYSKSPQRAFRFRRWISDCAELQGVQVYNAPRLLTWNISKRYLTELNEVCGIPVIPTVVIPAGDVAKADLRVIMAARKWNSVILKPCIGGGSRGCMRVDGGDPTSVEMGQRFLRNMVAHGRAADAQDLVSPSAAARQHVDLPSGEVTHTSKHAPVQLASQLHHASSTHRLRIPTVEKAQLEADIAAALAAGAATCAGEGEEHPAASAPTDMMVQPYVPSVESDGELSVVVIDGRITHAVQKLPRGKDFRTQEEWGGVVRPVTLSEEEKGMVQRVLRAANHCVEHYELPSYTSAVSPGDVASALPRPLRPDSLLIARLDFLRLTPEAYRQMTAPARSTRGAALEEVEEEAVGVDEEGPTPAGSPASTPGVTAAPGPAPTPSSSSGGNAGSGGTTPVATVHPDDTPLLLLELEIIEPCLFFHTAPVGSPRDGKGTGNVAADALAVAIEQRYNAAIEARTAAAASVPTLRRSVSMPY